MQKIKILDMAKIAIVGSLYVALTLLTTPISYGNIQFRFAEVLMLLVLYKKKYAISLIIGCLIANIPSPLGLPDLIFGPLATAISVGFMIIIKNKWLASLCPVVFNGIIIGLELYFILDLPFWISALEVALGEIVTVTIIGVPVMKLLEKNRTFRHFVMEEKDDIDDESTEGY